MPNRHNRRATAVTAKTATKPDSKSKLHLFGDDHALAHYSDTFIVSRDRNSGMANIAFFQATPPLPSNATGAEPKANLVAKIILSPSGYTLLLNSLQDNQVQFEQTQKKDAKA